MAHLRLIEHQFPQRKVAHISAHQAPEIALRVAWHSDLDDRHVGDNQDPRNPRIVDQVPQAPGKTLCQIARHCPVAPGPIDIIGVVVDTPLQHAILVIAECQVWCAR
jgi:hypothetical protein